MTETQRDAISSVTTGLMIYQTDGTVGFYYYNDSSWVQVAATSKTYSVDTFYVELGGYVIEVNSDVTHGLVVAMQDQGSSTWYEANDLLSNAANHDVNGAKFMDWRMPSKRELNLMYVVYSNGNGASLNPYFYWSSKENGYDSAWYHYFNNNGSQDSDPQGIDGKANPTYSVRAVRAF